MVPKEGFEPTHPCGYYVLNVARLPFRHFGALLNMSDAKRCSPGRSAGLSKTCPTIGGRWRTWTLGLPDSSGRLTAGGNCTEWAIEDLNLGPLACEASALTTELTARVPASFKVPHPREGGPVDCLNGNDRVRTCDLALMKRPLCR